MFKTHKTLYLIIVIIAAVGVSAGLLLAIQSFRTDEEVLVASTILQEGAVQTREDKERVKEADITNWQTYRNEEYGFEFKYPLGWKEYESLGGDYERVEFAEEGDDMGSAVVQIYRSKVDYDGYFHNLDNGFRIVSEESKNIMGINWTIIVAEEDKESSIEFYNVYTSYKDNTYFIGTRNFANSVDFINQILSTFKFIKPQVPIIKNSAPCVAVIQRAKNIETGEIRDFSTPCDVPSGWENIPDGPCPCQVGNTCYVQEACI